METASPLHPIQEPYATHTLDVGDGHMLYVEESGNPNGLPALFCHGGPGAGSKPDHRGYFNPATWRIVLFDQRGCGKSTCKDLLHANTTPHLIGDMERIRTHLNINQWHTVAGSSWGAALALAYAGTHPAAVKSVVVSSIFAADAPAIAWGFQPQGAATHFPKHYQAFMDLLGHPSNVPAALFAAVTGPNRAYALQVAQAWFLFDALTMETDPDEAAIKTWLAEHPDEILHDARLMLHYITHQCFFTPANGPLSAPKLPPSVHFLSHGLADLCCLPQVTEALHKTLPGSHYTAVPGAGHRSNDALKTARIRHLEAAARLP